MIYTGKDPRSLAGAEDGDGYMKPDRRLRLLSLASSFTFIMAGSIAAGYLLGQYLDRRTGGEGLLTVLFIFLGILAGFYNLYRIAGKKEKGD